MVVNSRYPNWREMRIDEDAVYDMGYSMEMNWCSFVGLDGGKGASGKYRIPVVVLATAAGQHPISLDLQ